jgi:hypothetical protein
LAQSEQGEESADNRDPSDRSNDGPDALLARSLFGSTGLLTLVLCTREFALTLIAGHSCPPKFTYVREV